METLYDFLQSQQIPNGIGPFDSRSLRRSKFENGLTEKLKSRKPSITELLNRNVTVFFAQRFSVPQKTMSVTVVNTNA